jgi:hypothetical protein
MAPPLTEAQMAAFEADGAILVDTPLSSAEMDRIEAAWDRITAKESTTWTDTDYLDMLTHPFFEAVVRQVLRADAVQVLETYPHNRPPSADLDPNESRDERDYRTWGGGHLDVQITRSGWDATPRKEMLAIWLWCNDVPLERGPMRVLKGSHLPIADHWDSVIHDPAKLAQLPRVHGLNPVTGRGEHEPGSGGTFSGIPELMDVPYAEQKPEKMIAKRGQALVFSQALLHQATANEDTVSRKAHIMSWTAASVPGFLATGRITGMRDYHAKIRAALLDYKPERAHLVPENFIHDISEYGNAPDLGGIYWEEMWLPVGQEARL